MNIPQDFTKTFDNIPWSKLGNHIVIAVSGGADSLALTLLLHHYLQDKNIKLTALTVDHGLRESSLNEAEKLNIQLKNLGIVHHILKWESKNIKTGIQRKARNARYNLMKNWCLKNNVSAIFLAHHQEDQIETFWLRMMKQSGLDGLACMSFLKQDSHSGIFFIRPLLNFSKQQLKDICDYYKQQWIEDPSNQKTIFTRNIIRQNINSFPLNQKDTQRLVNCFSAIRKNLQKHTISAIENCVLLHDEGYATLNINTWEEQPKEIQIRVLRNILMTISGYDYPPRSKKLNTAFFKIQNKENFTSFGCIINHQQDNFIISREASAINKQEITENNFFWDNRFKITYTNFSKNTYITALKTRGLSFLPKNERKLYISEYKKLSKYVRQSMPVFEKNGEIIAIPHINYNKENITIKFFPKTPISGIYIETV